MSKQSTHLRIQRGKVECDDKVGLTILDLVLEYFLRVERRVVDDSTSRFQDSEEADQVGGVFGK